MKIDVLSFIGSIVFLLLAWLVWKWKQRYLEPAILYAPLQNLDHRKSFRQLLAFLPRALKYAALGFFLLAWMDPHYFSERPQDQQPPADPKEGIAIYLILDESGSMMENVTMELPDRRRKTAPKIELLKTITEPFIKKRTNDLIGLVSFGRTAHIQAPLTLDHRDVIDKMLRLKPSLAEKDSGTAIGYAIFKTAHLIVATRHFSEDMIKQGKPSYEIKNSIIVLVTDGVQTVNPLDEGNTLRSMDIAEASTYAKENGIKLYIINVDPSILTEEMGPQRRLMQRAAELTGGKFYAVTNANNLGNIYTAIDQIEKSTLPPQVLSEAEQPDKYKRVSLYPPLLAAGLSCLCAAILLHTTFLRRTP